ncbi:MAG TPA: extracellular solute-binding protein [Ktedonobacteraceae bacterium]|jgi:raffinose/stachyose/melibiose transport system substrate-binding protein|nr:extracellular solute-binding protein [Ktedonobacteraceae bacterium]
MKKRFYLGILGILFTLIFTSCGGATSSTGPAKVTINWWHIQTTDPAKSIWQNIANKYMKAHPNVTIKITPLENEAFKSKLATDMQSGNPPDLFQSWGGGVLFQYAKAGLVQDITPELQKNGWGDSFNQAALSVYGQDSKYYGVPFDMGAVGFWYNKALFAKAGIAQPPATWDDLLQDVKKLKSAGITPIALGEKDKWPGHFYWVYLAIRMGGKAEFDKAYGRTGSFADPPYVEAGKHLQDLIALNPFQQGFLGATYNDQSTLIGNSKAAMELMGQWAPSTDASAATNKKGPELGFFPFPTVTGEKGNPTDVLGGGNGFAVGKNAPPETLDFLRYLISADTENTLGKQGLALPTIKGTISSVSNPLLQEVGQMVNNAPYFQLYYDQYLPPAVGQTIIDSVQGLYAKTLTPDAAAKAVEDSAATELQP